MPFKKHEPKEIIGKLREPEIVLAEGGSAAEAGRRIAVSGQTYYRWRNENGDLKTDQARRMKNLEKKNERLRRAIADLTLEKLPLQEATGKLLSPARRRRCIDHVRQILPTSERRICRVLRPHRSTQRKVPCGANHGQALTEDIIALAKQYGRYGYRRLTAFLRTAGWAVNCKRLKRIWRKEGLKVPQRQPKRGRLCLNDGSCIRLRRNIWCMPGRTTSSRVARTNVRKFRILTIIDDAWR